MGAILIGLSPLSAQSAQPRTGLDVLEIMQTRWQGKWYRTLAFSQVTRTIDEKGAETEGVWHEALEHPGKLRIDFAPLSEGSGVICTPERIHHFKGGIQTASQDTWNVLLILLGDVYCQDLARTRLQLEKLGFDLGRFHEEVWQDRTCLVVGARAGDWVANQFWIDRETLLVQRVIHRDPLRPAHPPREVQIREYRQVQGFPIASLIHFLKEGRLFFTEAYFDIRVNPELPAGLFDPARFRTVRMPLGTSVASPGTGTR